MMARSSDAESHSAVDFGRENTYGNVTISGKVAGRDLIEVTTTAEAAADVQTKQQLLDLIAQLQADIAKLTDAPEGDRDDMRDELAKAKQAAEKGDKDRLVNKLESARTIMVTLSGAIPAALKLSEAIGALLQRVPGLL